MKDDRFWAGLATLVSSSRIVIDRPQGSTHPHVPAMVYPLDYGYLEGTASGDGEGIDVWIGSLTKQKVTGVVCSVDANKRDAEVKILLGCSRSEMDRVLSFHNQGGQAAILLDAP
jgi:inorganic pyrophosphatase